MIIGSIKEKSDLRVALTPRVCGQLIKLGYSICLEQGYAEHLFLSSDYEALGVRFCDVKTVLKSELVLQIKCAKETMLSLNNTILISFLDPFFSLDNIQTLASRGVTSFAMECVPRISRAQKLDALSSQASLSGYMAVVLAAERLNKVLPMMVTPSGTIKPSKVFVVGAGVAGLQAIATAKRMGAQVEAFDTRSAVEEQVESLGAKFLKIDLGELNETASGYAQALNEDQLIKQRDLMLKACSEADIVITTAQLFAKKAPILITQDMISSMKKGSVVVDLVVSSGGNVEGVQLNKETLMPHGVLIIGYSDLSEFVAKHASEMYSSNLKCLIEEYTQHDPVRFVDKDDDLLGQMLITKGGHVCHLQVLDNINKEMR